MPWAICLSKHSQSDSILSPSRKGQKTRTICSILVFLSRTITVLDLCLRSANQNHTSKRLACPPNCFKGCIVAGTPHFPKLHFGHHTAFQKNETRNKKVPVIRSKFQVLLHLSLHHLTLIFVPAHTCPILFYRTCLKRNALYFNRIPRTHYTHSAKYCPISVQQLPVALLELQNVISCFV